MTSRVAVVRVRALVLASLGTLPLLTPVPGLAQNPLDTVRAVVSPPSQEGETRDQEDTAASPQPPGIDELVPRSVTVQREAEEAETEIRRLGDLGEMVATTRELEQAGRRLVGELEGAEGTETSHGTEVAAFQERVDLASGDLRQRLRRLDALRSTWRDRRELWRAWRQQLAEGDLPSLTEQAERSLDRIEQVLAAVDDAVNRAVEVQRRLESVRGGLPDLVRKTGLLPGAEETRRIRRDAPLLGSALHREQLREGFLGPLRKGLGSLSPPGSLFWERHSGALALQLLLLLAAGLLARYFRGWSGVGEEWSGILDHPWVLGVFVATAPSNLLYVVAPPFWRLLLWTLFAASGAVLAAGTFRSSVKRWTIYGLAGGSILLLALDVLSLPAAWLRLVVVAVAAVGGGLMLVAGRHAARQDEDRRGFHLLARVSTAVLAVTLLAEVLGYDAFARGLLEAALATAFVLLAVALLLRLGRGVIRASIYRISHRIPLLRRVGQWFAVRLSWLYQALLVLFAILELTSIWGLFSTPGAAFAAVWGWRFGTARHELTLGEVLVAVLTVYLAFVISTLLRSSLEGEVLAKRDFDPGVSSAIGTLLHYLLVTLGFFFALSVLGFDLSSLALVIGALGVGVGLGLQDLVKNFFSGLVLLFERPVRVGDTVILDGEWATVKKIGLRATTVTTFDRSEIIVPNGDLTSKQVTNWTLSDQVSRLTVRVGVAYGSDVERVFRILEEAAAQHPDVLEDPAPSVLFMGFGDSSLDFELRVWVGSIDVRLTTFSDLHASIDRRFREDGITIPFPQRDVHFKSGLPLGEAVGSDPDSRDTT